MSTDMQAGLQSYSIHGALHEEKRGGRAARDQDNCKDTILHFSLATEWGTKGTVEQERA
jgi:hypothetical protein